MDAAPRTLRTEPLTREAFAPFGDVITAGAGPGRDTNLGTAVRFDWTAALENTREAARPNLAVFRATPQALPFRVTLLERHPCSSQVFAPLVADRWLVIVAPELPGGTADAARLRAFVARAGQGVHLRRGLWHHPIVVLDRAADLLMLAWEDGTARDCEERKLDAPVDVVADD